METLRAALPHGYAFIRALDPAGAVVLARHGSELRVVRTAATGKAAAEQLAELAALARIEHPSIARLVDHGALPTGETFVARQWVEGRDLVDWAAGRARDAAFERELARIAIDVAEALDALHAQGFVHGDVKAQNVVVTPAGRGVLCDFGLARRAGESGAAGGSFVTAAPEQLLGAEVGAPADLFSLGATLAWLLLEPRIAPRELYARFPAEPFLDAARVDAARIGDAWRDVVVELVEREPAARPATAARVARTLARRFALDTQARGAATLSRFSARTGREAFLEAELARCAEALDRGGARGVFAWWNVARDDDAVELLEELRWLAALRGARTWPVMTASTAATRIDRRAAERESLRSEPLVFLDATRGGAERSAAERVGRYLSAACTRRDDATALVVAARTPPDDASLGWTVVEVPRPGHAEVAAFLRRELDPLDHPRVDALARLVVEDGPGSSEIAARLQRLERQGWIVAGDERPRLRPGAPPDAAAVRGSTEMVAGTSAARATWTALGACAVPLELATLAAIAGLAEDDTRAAVRELERAGLAAVEHGGPSPRVRVRAAPALDLVEEAVERRIAARAAEHLAALGEPPEVVLPLRVRAAPDDPAARAALLACARDLRDGGAPERALLACERALDAFAARGKATIRVELAPDCGRRGRKDAPAATRAEPREGDARSTASAGLSAAPDALVAELALAWIAVGHPERAEDLALALEARPETAARAFALAVRSQVCAARNDLEAALAHAHAARELAPEFFELAVLPEARALYELRRDDELARLEALARERGASSRVLGNVRTLVAMSALRAGRVDEARTLLDALSADARARGDARAEAAVRQNLGVLARRSGDESAARAHLRAASAVFEALGALASLAQARLLLGSVLRDAGEPREAAELSLASLELRERLGDAHGAAAARGMHGLALADQGLVRAAARELDAAARALLVSGRSVEAALLDARATEVSARAGIVRAGAGSKKLERALDADPRTLAARSRTALLCRDEKGATELARRALDLARSLSQHAIAAEAELALDLASTGGAEPSANPPGGEAPAHAEHAPLAVREDRAIWRGLADGFDAAKWRELASDLEHRGRLDRAARVRFALAAQASSHDEAWSEHVRARALVETCARGLSAGEAAALERALLGAPDPRPQDLDPPPARGSTTEDDMEIVELLEINARLVREDRIPALLGSIVDAALRVTRAERGFVVLAERGELVFQTALDSRRGGIEAPELEVSRSIVRAALDEGRPLRLSNASDDPDVGAAPSVAALELRSILCVPFTIDEDASGVLYVDHRLRAGAFDARAERLLDLLGGQAALALRQARRVEEIRRLNGELEEALARKESDLRMARTALRAAGVGAPVSGMIGSSSAMRDVHALIARAAPTKISVLVTGESGTGKELAARAIHAQSPRTSAPFVAENCAAFPSTLIEAELFGAKKGAFTGADVDREGLFERAHGGTVFLDEIGELPLELQAKLLRVLETGIVRRVGDSKERAVDFRLVVATNRDLEAEVREGRFRADLYYRLDGLKIAMPPLSARVEDIPELVEHFLRLEGARNGRTRRVAPEVLARLVRRAWPGNVRELSNEVARLCVLCERDLDDPSLVREPSRASVTAAASGAGAPVRTLAELERNAIETALAAARGDRRKAAEMLGISRAKIYQRLKEWREAGEPAAGDDGPDDEGGGSKAG